MPAPEVQGFFQGFNFDTLLALISCAAGVVALFISGAAYNQCRIIKNSFNDKKEFEDNSQDHSQRAAGDIINNNGMSDSQLMTFTTALTTLSNDNFSKAIDQMYATFRVQTDENMKNIISEAERIVRDSKWQIAGYTKLDWINIYFESAKNASDLYMQRVWAKVLAMEMASPGKFSFKSLDVLKNMSSEDFALFEKMVSLDFMGALFNNNELKKYLSWTEQLKLSEIGLLNLEDSERSINVSNNEPCTLLICNSTLALFITSEKENTVAIRYGVRVFTNVAKELSVLATTSANDEYYINSFKEIKNENKENCNIALYSVFSVTGDHFQYYKTDLMLEPAKEE